MIIMLPSEDWMLSKRASVVQRKRPRMLQRPRSACRRRLRIASSTSRPLQPRGIRRWPTSSWLLPRLFPISYNCILWVFWFSSVLYPSSLECFFFLFSDASGITFHHGALDYGDALADSAAAIEDRCATA